MKSIRLILCILLLMTCLPPYGFSQEENPGQQDYAENVFRGTFLLNSPTTEMIPPHSFNFMIRHRFGEIGPDNSISKQFLGLDLIANIRFSFGFPIGKHINFDVGRSKFGKTYDGSVKAQLYRQVRNGFPVSLSVCAAMDYMSDAFPGVQSNAFFEDLTTSFHYKESHRFSYKYQALVSRQFSDKLSLLLTPTYVYKNLAPVDRENGTILLTAGLSYKTGLESSFIFEGSYLFNNQADNDLFPLSVGWEWGTTGHIFQIIVATTNQLSPAEMEIAEPSAYNKGKVYLGFNLSRSFWSKKFKESH
ncbi:MAG: hypothetical protein IT242_06535 [Bacteroidia bacterium]|nr:hypothetical protein [Bacteroidia bacterium]